MQIRLFYSLNPLEVYLVVTKLIPIVLTAHLVVSN